MNFQFFKMILVILFLRTAMTVNVNSHSGIYDLSGKCKQEISSIRYTIIVHQGQIFIVRRSNPAVSWTLHSPKYVHYSPSK